MNELKLKVRKKIYYTSGHHIVDTSNNNNGIIVFLGPVSAELFKPYMDDFLKDTLKCRIPDNRITTVQIDSADRGSIAEKICEAVKNVELNSLTKNELHISFITCMDDDIYNEVPKIDISLIEDLKKSTLGGYSVDILYDFYGIFTSAAKDENRDNAKKTVLDFLRQENGGLAARKRVYHQICPGSDYYRSAKSLTFMILANFIGKIDSHSVVESATSGDSYTWTTFALSEKNLASLVVYELINKLLENQRNGVEVVPIEDIQYKINDKLKDVSAKLKNLVPASDVDYVPFSVREVKKELSFKDKINIFKKDKGEDFEYRMDREDESINALLEQQRQFLSNYLDTALSDSELDEFMRELVGMCTVMGSIDNSTGESRILTALKYCKNECAEKQKNIAITSVRNYSVDYYIPKYEQMLAGISLEVVDKMIEYYEENMAKYVAEVQQIWNKMHVEVSASVNDFATFKEYFVGIDELIGDAKINLLCTYDDILEKLDFRRIFEDIRRSNNIYSNVLSSYFGNVRKAGDIAMKFGSLNIVPDSCAFRLYSSIDVSCPDGLELDVDDYWFREHEIAILLTAKNRMEDCNNLYPDMKRR